MDTILGVAPHVLVGLLLAAMLAGWVDAVSGGGGLVQLPALLVGLPGVAPATVLGTNKLSSIIGTSAAARTYRRAAVTDVATAVPMAVAAFAGSAIGAAIATRLPGTWFRPLALVLLVVVGLWTLLRPALGESQDLRWHGGEEHHRHRVAAVAMGGGIGLYDGVFGPGTGTFLVFGLVALLGYSFLNASAIAKIVNVATNLAALIVFGATGHVLWGLGLAMGAANLTGAVIGARTAVRKGSRFVRVVFLVVVGVLLLRLGYDVLRG
ncbi:MAG TPA: TSUP family transporter [Candidatus Nanopelagicales bacterium]|nr:TSUP family transporter [Candidatus Nanopelagicales bacterium]